MRVSIKELIMFNNSNFHVYDFPLGGGMGSNNSLMGMLQGMLNRPITQDPVSYAKSLDSEWRVRAGQWKSFAKMQINDLKAKVNKLCIMEESDENVAKIAEYCSKCDELRGQVIDIDEILKQEEPLTFGQVQKISSLELERYKSVIEPVREKIIEAQNHRRELERLANEMFEKIENMWESGKPTDIIKEYIKETLIRMYPNAPNSFIERFSNQTLQMGTAHLAERIRLTPEQIEMLKVTTISEELTEEERRCSTCLDTFASGDEIKVLPCNDKHIFHKECIDPWFERKTTCPLCKEDMRKWLDPEYENETTSSDSNAFSHIIPPESSVAPNQEELQNERQMELLNNFLNSFSDTLSSIFQPPSYEDF